MALFLLPRILLAPPCLFSTIFLFTLFSIYALLIVLFDLFYLAIYYRPYTVSMHYLYSLYYVANRPPFYLRYPIISPAPHTLLGWLDFPPALSG